MFTIIEVAKHLKCSPALIYALCKEGRLPHLRLGLGRGTIRVQAEDLETFKRECRVQLHPLLRAAASPGEPHRADG